MIFHNDAKEEILVMNSSTTQRHEIHVLFHAVIFTGSSQQFFVHGVVAVAVGYGLVVGVLHIRV